jgi:heme O synthase-like polyprenyltransferase
VTRSPSTLLADHWSLTKPDINLLIGITTAAGSCLGLPPQLHGFPFVRLFNPVVATLLVAGGTWPRSDPPTTARRLLLALIVYLPMIFVLMVLDRQ